MAEFSEVMRQWRRFCKSHNNCGECEFDGKGICGEAHLTDIPYADIELRIMAWAAEHPEPVYETWFEYLLRIGVIPENAPAGGEYQWIVESIKHKHISNDIAESLKLHPKEVQA